MGSVPTVAAYGTWNSSISIDLVTESSVSFDEIYVNPTTGAIYLLESRPAEGGRSVIVEQRGSQFIDILPKGYSARSKIFDYGGGTCATSQDGSLVFTDSETNGVFRIRSADVVEAIVHGSENIRYANFDVHPIQTNLILAVQEDHSLEPLKCSIVAINAENRSVETIVQGANFYANPKFSCDGTKVCWMQWEHPDLPWLEVELYVADWTKGRLEKARSVEGGSRTQSISRPQWHEDGSLFFASDRTGFAQLYRFDPKRGHTKPIVCEGFQDVDFAIKSAMRPHGFSTYIFLSFTQLVTVYTRNAKDGVLLIDLVKSTALELPLGIVETAYCVMQRVSETRIIILGSEVNTPNALYLVDITNPSSKTLLKSTTAIQLPLSIYSIPQDITFPRTRCKSAKGVAHAILFPPHNSSFNPLPGTKPPVIFYIHGGPTMHIGFGLNLPIQYWTSRGYAYVLLNHAGSTGYGRLYQDEINGSFGIKDIADAASCLDYLAKAGLVDGQKAGIKGHSSGAYTVLNSLVRYPKVWAAGISMAVVSDMRKMDDFFQQSGSEYLSRLLFQEGATEEEKNQIYWDRSPCFHADKIESPLLLLQGRDDAPIAVDMAVEMAKVIEERGKYVKLVVFDNEGHVFRKKETKIRVIEEEEALWKRTLL